MKNSFVSITAKTGLGVCLLLLVGCGSSSPSRFYVLSPLPGEGKVLSEDSCASVGMGPIRLPEYANRPQIVNHTTPDEFVLSNFDLWAEPLSDSVPRVLAENLSRLRCTKDILLFPWRPSIAPDYQVEMEVLRMDGTFGGAVSLEAWWSVSSRGEKKTRITRKTSYSEPVGGRDYTALVQAHSRALGALSREIATALKELGAP
jgi:uncharacterized protein